MRFWPEIHWSEGQFLRPQHFQAAFRFIETQRAAVAGAIHPYVWGFIALDLPTDGIEGGILEVRTAELLLRDGTYVRVPDNCTIDPRDFRKVFDASPGAMPVYFGVPELQRVRANVHNAGEILDGRNPRYTIDISEVNDENTGENPQALEVRRLRGALFLGDEDRTGFSCVTLGRIERSAAGPSLIKNTIPPLLRLRAWAPLCAGLDSIWNDIRSRCEQLGADAEQRGLTFATGGPGDIEQLVKLGALNELMTRFGAIAGSPELHPHVLYTALCESIGKVALWDDPRRPRELPAYDHDDSGPVFEELFRYLRALIQKMLPKDYIERPFENKDNGFSVELDNEWLSPNYDLFLGIQSVLQPHEIEALFAQINFRLASPTSATEVFNRRLPGLSFKNAGAVPNLPRSADQHYFRIARTPPYWLMCEKERSIYILMPRADLPKMAPMRKISLFVTKLRK